MSHYQAPLLFFSVQSMKKIKVGDMDLSELFEMDLERELEGITDIEEKVEIEIKLIKEFRELYGVLWW